jgi:NAD(P)-dependent dehydrogenase (short-subunit alcohol dehydrogenase family)
MSTALIIGASRGIGHELVRQYRADGWRVIATARKPRTAPWRARRRSAPARRHERRSDRRPGLEARRRKDRPPGWWPACTVRDHDGFPTEQEFDAVMHTNVLAAMRLLPIVAPLVAHARQAGRDFLAHGFDRRAQQQPGLAVPRQQGGAELGAGRCRADLRPARRDLPHLPSRLGADRHGRQPGHADRQQSVRGCCAPRWQTHSPRRTAPSSTTTAHRFPGKPFI